ncbi:hypothetical protein T7987_07820 [Sulfitobacter faviae]|uniref:Uncharacterized protein n=1 Tax=Sulfitobacter faviae TaxID=1775881 RepID=A0ABZ0V571_9RHOB|nr:MULTISPECIES: hypothetical protein [Sulfitobacter]WPZ23127.1 hypothetical protein T7987_07820 [Sulfitobacter faviae]WPZ28168.1 hypothetical protein T8A63_10900 [Sulfitobacter sp. OXR-159]
MMDKTLEGRISALEKKLQIQSEVLEFIPSDMSALAIAFGTACDLLDEIKPGSFDTLCRRIATQSQVHMDDATEVALNELISRISKLHQVR